MGAEIELCLLGGIISDSIDDLVVNIAAMPEKKSVDWLERRGVESSLSIFHFWDFLALSNVVIELVLLNMMMTFGHNPWKLKSVLDRFVIGSHTNDSRLPYLEVPLAVSFKM